MKKKMMRKFLSLFMTMMLILATFATPVFATGGIMGEVFGVSEVTPTITDGEIKDMASEVLGIIKYVGLAIAMGMVLYAGMKYMMSAANEKAELKNSSIRLVIGAVIIAGASVMFPAFWDVFSKIAE